MNMFRTSPCLESVSSLLDQLNSNGRLCFSVFSHIPPVFQEHQNANLIAMWVCGNVHGPAFASKRASTEGIYVRV